MNTNKNPLLCDPQEGICATPDSTSGLNMPHPESAKTLKLVYFTDPICSSCWGIEPQLRKLKLEYGSLLDIEYRMGGLLPDWSYNSGGISKPSDVAKHWDEVSAYYQMPIDGDVWLESPLHSSYPPSIAFKAAQMQDPDKAILFLREIREMVFLQKKNICQWEHLEKAAQQCQLDLVRFKSDFEGPAQAAFQEDLKLARTYGVRGFPTIFLFNLQNEREMIYGSKPYAHFELAIHKLAPGVQKNNYPLNWESLFHHYPGLCTREYSELSGVPMNVANTRLQELASEGKLEQFKTKNGSLWKISRKEH